VVGAGQHAEGFLLKDMPGEDIVTAVRQAARGSDSLLAPAVTRRLIQQFAESRPAARSSVAELGTLTHREIDVLRQVAHGMSNAEIAQHLFIAETTVKTHIARLLMKLSPARPSSTRGLRIRVGSDPHHHPAANRTTTTPLTSAA
jgi:DNA-binding NarL/FixJ family response regulator